MYSINDSNLFYKLFEGAKDFYGVTIVGEMQGEKRQSTSTCIHETPLPTVYLRHLNGEQSLGISSLKADNSVSFGAIDIDSYQGDLSKVVRAIYRHDLPICPCHSKSNKLHLYFFFDTDTPAEDAVDIMRWYARAFRCNREVEVFPKQTKRSRNNKAYSWINLPYFDANNEYAGRKMVDESGQEVGLDEFLTRAQTCRLSIKQHREAMSGIICHDAPPCILSGALLGDIPEGRRNTWLFSAAVYFKLKDESCDLEVQLDELNESLDDPLPAEELHNTVLKSLQRKTYFYQCSQLVDLCDKQQCTKLDFGVGSTKTTGLDYGALTQINSDPPTYQWEVNGQIMEFESEKQLLQQERFRELCLRYLHIVPRKVDDTRWAKIVTKACEHIIIKQPDSEQGDFSVGSIFLSILAEFFGEQRRARDVTQIGLGRVWLDPNTQLFVFTADSLMNYVREVKGFREFKVDEIGRRLVKLGARQRGQTWELPSANAPKKEVKKVIIDMDLKEGESADF